MVSILRRHKVFYAIVLQLIIYQGLALGASDQQTPTYYLKPDKKITQYNVQSWSTADGLPTSSLLSLCQTTDGYLWVSSYDGLIRFDGNEFQVFNKSNVDVFESNTIRKLAEGNNGTLWMTTQGNGLVSYKNGRFIRYGTEQGINHLYRALYIDQKNRIWSASPDKGWFYFEKGEFHFLEYSKPLFNIEVRSIEQSNNGDMWFGTFGSGLFRYSDGNFTQYTSDEGLLNNWIYSLFYDSDGILWVGTSNGLCYFNGNEFISVPELGQVTINDIFEDKHNSLWVATNNGLYRKNMNSGVIEYLNANNGLPHSFINDFLMDMEGNIWMAFYKGGMAQLKDGKFTNYTSDGGLNGKVVNALCSIGPEKVLTAFDNGQFSIIEGENIYDYKLRTNLEGERIRHILKDSKDNLWFSTYKGLLKVSGTGRETRLNEKTGFPQTKIRLTFEDSQGNIWVGTRNNGVIRISGDNTYTSINASNGLSANLIMSIDEDKNGNILVGTSEGESGFNVIAKDGTIRQFAKNDGFLGNVIFNSYCDSAGNIWVASLGGLNLIRDGVVTSFTTKNGWFCDSPFDVLEDDYGNLWLPCSKGVMKLDKSELLGVVEGELSKVSCRLFDRHDGMVESECNATAQSLKTHDGLLMFPTISGIAQIDPTKILINNFIPPVYISEFIVDGSQIDILAKHTFEPGIRRVTFNYTAISLYEPEKIHFKYMLEGFDKDWIEAGNERSISYTNLKHGSYKFRVLASNNDGIWNTSGASLDFVLKPKFINTLWFYLLLSTLIIIIVYFIYKIRIRQLKHRQAELEVVIDERTAEVKEKNYILEQQKAEIEVQTEYLEEQKKELNILNASKDKMFSIIGHDLRSPLGNFRTILDMMVNTPDDFDEIEQAELLLMLSHNAQSTYELLENLLNWSSSQRGVITYEPSTLKAKAVLEVTIRFVNPMAQKKHIQVISAIDDDIEVFADENMLRAIFRNLIVNAIKFTRENGTIEVSAERQSNTIVFGVKDNGIGILPEIKVKLFNNPESTIRMGTNEEKGSGLGLLLCKEFVEKHHGKIWVESEVGNGSVFYFTMPITEN